MINLHTEADDIKRGDLKTLEQGLRQGWDFPEETFRAIPRLMVEIIGRRHPDGHAQAGQYVSTRREQISAARVLAVMHGQNLLANPAPQQVNINGSFGFDLSVAEQMSREEMAAVTRVLGVSSNGRHNGNGEHPSAEP